MSEEKRQTTFETALQEYLDSLPRKKRICDFIVESKLSFDPASLNILIEEATQKVEAKYSDKSIKGVLYGVLRRFIQAFRSYHAVIDTLIQANPLPGALIWGGIKVFLDVVNRSLNLFETIKDDLKSIALQIQTVTDYDYLYPDSEHLQRLLCSFYINIFRFWHRVDKECKRSAFSALMSSITTVSVVKLRKIVENIKKNADEIAAQADLVERGEAKQDRRENQQERVANQKDREQNEKWRNEQRESDFLEKIRKWISAETVHEDMEQRYNTNISNHKSGTNKWLFEHYEVTNWQSGAGANRLWVHGPPGSGKSVLASYLIRCLRETEPDAVITFYFYRFDQQYKALDILRLFALQLFDKFVKLSLSLSDQSSQKCNGLISCSREDIEQVLKEILHKLPKVYFIIDGLDEAWGTDGTRKEAVSVISYLVDLSKDFSSIRIWYSSQFREDIKAHLSLFTSFSIREYSEQDVEDYIQEELQSLPVLLGTLRLEAIEGITSHAHGHFLWASRIVAEIKEASSVKEAKEALDNIPATMEAYYQNILDRYRAEHLDFVSKIFSLILFARRPLSLKELREALGILASDNPSEPEEDAFPFITAMKKRFEPLIEIQPHPDDEEDGMCRLFHSTLQIFLLRHSDIFVRKIGVQSAQINGTPISEACFRYLSQKRYSSPLRRDGERFIDANGDSVEQHHFLAYSAKYWDKHLDWVPQTESLRKDVKAFVLSTNFLTCVQVQGLWVESQFQIFRRESTPGNFFRRIFPLCLKGGSDKRLWEGYRTFLHEWGYFLRCWTCSSPTCPILPFRGQIDRCFGKALGSKNFLSHLKGRYHSFSFQCNPRTPENGQSWEGISESGSEIRILRLQSQKQKELIFTCEYWRFPETSDSNPKQLRNKTTIVTDELKTDWRLFVTGKKDIAKGKSRPIAFSSDLNLLRIGSQIFKADHEGNYISFISEEYFSGCFPPCIEEAELRDNIVVLASRKRVYKATAGLGDDDVVDLGKNLLNMEERILNNYIADDDLLSDSSGYTESSYQGTDNEAYETMSERPTEESVFSDLDNDLITPWTRRADFFELQNDSSSGEDSESLSSSTTSSDEEKSENSKSTESEIDIPFWTLTYGEYVPDTDSESFYIDHFDQLDDQGSVGPRKTRGEERSKGFELYGTLLIYDCEKTPHEKIFQLSRRLSANLYCSPPAIHPSQSLIVWPLSRGDLLFADFSEKTYFIQRLRPTTTYTRHIFMRCRFSHCGQYLHILSLEAQLSPHKKKALPRLAAIALTYKLSHRKPKRSPPTLIHRVRIQLQTIKSLCASKLPFTVTWRAEDVYLTVSDALLTVYRFPLFRNEGNRNSEVLVPQKTIFLPNTVRRREVFFFPSNSQEDAKIFIGGETPHVDSLVSAVSEDDQLLRELDNDPKHAATDAVEGLKGGLGQPMGCTLTQADLGDYIPSKKTSRIPHDFATGKLSHRMENFNPEDDCDLELYVF